MILSNADRNVHEFYQSDELPEKLFGYPPALVKACGDYFDYAAGMRDGTVIRFAEACPINAEWVRLDFEPDAVDGGLPFPCPRGVDVRVSEIVWVADAPEGS